jgi:hypothetical protein
MSDFEHVGSNAAPFTVRWEYKIEGVSRQRLIEADQVHVAYDERPQPGGGRDLAGAMLGIYSVPSTGIVVLGEPSDGSNSMALTFGKVYVMNREGKTVATYKLADPDENTQGLGFKPKPLHQLYEEAGGVPSSLVGR